MSEEAIEILRCAEINFNNTAKFMPGLVSHPIFMLAMEQLKQGLAMIDADEDPTP
jgi:hypothetical protein